MLSVGRTNKIIEEVMQLVLPAMIAIAADPVIVVGIDGKVKLANHHAYRVFGYDAGELEGISLDELIPDRYRKLHKQHRKEYMVNPVTRATRSMGDGQDLFARRRDGSEFTVEIGLTPVGPNAQPGKLVMAYVRKVD